MWLPFLGSKKSLWPWEESAQILGTHSTYVDDNSSAICRNWQVSYLDAVGPKNISIPCDYCTLQRLFEKIYHEDFSLITKVLDIYCWDSKMQKSTEKEKF